MSGQNRSRLAIVTTHPIQYNAPWFRRIAAKPDLNLRVFYLWNPTASNAYDPGFSQLVEWDLPLLEGYDYEFVPNTSRRPGTDHFFGLRNPQLLNRLRAFQPTAALLIGYNYLSLMKLILRSAKARGFPLLMRGDSHRLVTQKSSAREFPRRCVIGTILRRFDAVLYVGKANREYFREHGVPAERLFFSPHAVDNERFIEHPEIRKEEAVQWRRDIGIPDNHLLILFAGKLQEKKRPLDLLEAFLRLKRDDVSLLFVGAGPLEQQLRERAKGAAHVYFAPFQNQTLMPRTYAAADLFVLPSFGSEESWGLAVNEALCLKLPVIVSTHVGCSPDLVQSRRNGLVYPAGNIGALALALEEALQNRVRLRAWGEEGRAIVTRYNFESATAGLLKALEEVSKNKAEAAIRDRLPS